MENHKSFLLVNITLAASIGGFLFGYDTGVIGGANLYIEDEFNLTPFEEESIVSIAILGALIGAGIGGYLSDKWGRKYTLLLADITFTIGAILMAFATGVLLLLAGRLVVGIGVGIASFIVPVYLAEIAPSRIRGRMIGMNIVLVTGGQFISILICYSLNGEWRWMLGLASVPSILQFFIVLWLPESPRWLFKQGREEEAKAVLVRISGIDIDGLVEEIRKELFVEQQGRPIELLKEIIERMPKALWIAVGLQFFQQFIGINTAMYYGPQVLQKAGFDSDKQSTIIAALPISFLNFLGTSILACIIDKVGRRFIMLVTLPIIACVLALLSIAFYDINYGDGEFGQNLAIFALGTYVFFFALGISSTPWAINSEIFPLQYRSVANSISTMVNWLSNFTVSMSFLSIMDSKPGEVLAWSGLGLFALAAFLFVYILVPETKGKSLDQIFRFFYKNKREVPDLISVRLPSEAIN